MRGPLLKMSITCGAAPGLARSKTLTASSSKTVTNAFPPAKATSLGSSPTGIVLTVAPAFRSTTLTESESRLTTQASESVRALTVTGSSPTGIAASGLRLPSARTVKTSSRASGVLTARRRPPEGVSAIGWTCDDSRLT